MTYELAKQLKDAGFPQTNPIAISTEQISEEQVREYQVSCPTLSELIEACGDTKNIRGEIGEYGIQFSDGNWYAAFSDRNYHEIQFAVEMGKTPEEAVAKLWLALNTSKEAKGVG